MTRKIYDGKGLLGRGNIILEIDENGNIYTPGAFNSKDYVGRVDDQGRIYKGIGIYQSYVGRIDENGNLYDSSSFGGSYIGNISDDGILRDHTAFRGTPTSSVGMGLSKTRDSGSTNSVYNSSVATTSNYSYSTYSGMYVSPFHNAPLLEKGDDGASVGMIAGIVFAFLFGFVKGSDELFPFIAGSVYGCLFSIIGAPIGAVGGIIMEWLIDRVTTIRKNYVARKKVAEDNFRLVLKETISFYKEEHFESLWKKLFDSFWSRGKVEGSYSNGVIRVLSEKTELGRITIKDDLCRWIVTEKDINERAEKLRKSEKNSLK